MGGNRMGWSSEALSRDVRDEGGREPAYWGFAERFRAYIHGSLSLNSSLWKYICTHHN